MLAKETSDLLGCGTLDVECIRRAPTHKFLEAAKLAVVVPRGVSEAIQRFSPVVDGETVMREPFDAFNSGQNIVNVPLLAGSNLNDGVLFSWAIASKPLKWEEYLAICAGIFQEPSVVDLFSLYPPDLSGDNRPVLAKLLTDFFFACPTRWMLRKAEQAGLTDLFLYRFSHQPPFKVWPKGKDFCNHFVCHGDEIPYVYFDSGAPFPWTMAPNSTDFHLSTAMSKYWQTFASTGIPSGNFTWPKYTTKADQSIELQWPLSVKKGLQNDQCNLLDKLGYKHIAKYSIF